MEIRLPKSDAGSGDVDRFGAGHGRRGHGRDGDGGRGIELTRRRDATDATDATDGTDATGVGAAGPRQQEQQRRHPLNRWRGHNFFFYLENFRVLERNSSGDLPAGRLRDHSGRSAATPGHK